MTGAQRGDFDRPPASSPTDRRDADDAVFAAELARLDGLEVADVAADVREQADALLSRTRAHMAWRGSRGGSLLSEDFAFLAGWDAARTAMFAALKPAPGTDAKGICQAFTGCVNSREWHALPRPTGVVRRSVWLRGPQPDALPPGGRASRRRGWPPARPRRGGLAVDCICLAQLLGWGLGVVCPVHPPKPPEPSR